MQRFDSEHDNESQTLLRSARNNFYTTIPLIWDRTENVHFDCRLQAFKFFLFLKCTLNLEYFEKKDQSHSLSITEIINSETSSYLKV